MEFQSRPRRESHQHPEIKVYGIQSCLALADQRPSDIVRVYLVEERLREFAHVLKQCAAERKAYHMVTTEEMENVTESRHHEGVCILAKQKRLETLDQFIARNQKATGSLCLLALEDVANPHNVGAILRVGAHFGVDGILLMQEDLSEKVLSSAIYRTAEGGVEFLSIIPCREPVDAVHALRKVGFKLVATSSHARKSIYASPLPERSVILMGSESLGLSQAALRESDVEVAIPGAGNIESLNVACAASVCLGEFWRQHRAAEEPLAEIQVRQTSSLSMGALQFSAQKPLTVSSATVSTTPTTSAGRQFSTRAPSK